MKTTPRLGGEEMGLEGHGAIGQKYIGGHQGEARAGRQTGGGLQGHGSGNHRITAHRPTETFGCHQPAEAE